MNASYLSAGLLFLALLAAGGAEPPAAAVSAETDLSIHPDAARMFPAQVQPVLMNLCARCHCRPDHPGGFKLTRVSDGYSNAQATSRNLRVAAAFVRADGPGVSPLLVKAVSPHGGMKDPPLYGRGHPAFRHLELWATHALIGGPAPARSSGVVTAAVNAPTPSSATSSEPPALPGLPSAEVRQAVAEATRTAARPNPNDPFDPALFNQTARPGGK